MITKITAHKLLLAQSNIFNFAKLIQQGRSMISQIPMVELPVRARNEQEDRFSKRTFYNINNYVKKDKPARCKYYALQYKNRIYHVFNAYYYPMGRMMGKIATAIRGKNSPLYRNSQADVKNGDICVIVNAVDPLFTGKKLLYKNLKYHTGFIGHLRTFSYKKVLNTKPELLYFYLLRKMMPKNKVSAKYLQNVKIYRGPTHDLPYLPQFAPDRNIYQFLPQADLDQVIKYHPDIKVVAQSKPGLAKQTHGRDFQYYDPPQQQQRRYNEQISQGQDTTKLHVQKQQTKTVLALSENQMAKLKRKEQRMLLRYKDIRAPYKKKSAEDSGFVYLNKEKQARQMPEYKIMADQDLIQEDQEIIDDPFGRKAKEAAAKKEIADKKKQKQNKK